MLVPIFQPTAEPTLVALPSKLVRALAARTSATRSPRLWPAYQTLLARCIRRTSVGTSMANPRPRPEDAEAIRFSSTPICSCSRGTFPGSRFRNTRSDSAAVTMQDAGHNAIVPASHPRLHDWREARPEPTHCFNEDRLAPRTAAQPQLPDADGQRRTGSIRHFSRVRLGLYHSRYAEDERWATAGWQQRYSTDLFAPETR